MAKLSTGWIIALIAVVLFVAVPDFQTAVTGIFKSGPAGTNTNTANILDGKCLEHDAITMTVGPVLKRYAPDTSVGTIWDRVEAKENVKRIEQAVEGIKKLYSEKLEERLAAIQEKEKVKRPERKDY